MLKVKKKKYSSSGRNVAEAESNFVKEVRDDFFPRGHDHYDIQ